MVRLTRLLARTEPSQPLADRLIAALTPTLEMDGGAITIGYEAAKRSTLSATDPLAERVEELQDVLREGPSLDAFRTARPVAEGPAGQQSRWPTLSQLLSESHEAILLYAVPMMPDSRVLGVVSMYRHTGASVDFDREGAQFLADAIGVAPRRVRADRPGRTRVVGPGPRPPGDGDGRGPAPDPTRRRAGPAPRPRVRP